MCLRQAYKRREIIKVKWINGNERNKCNNSDYILAVFKNKIISV